MLRRLELENFRGFGALETEIHPVTVFLGPNSSGKTTVLHAIRLACDAVGLALHSDTPIRIGKQAPIVEVVADMLVDHTRLLPLAEWQALFVDRQVGENKKLWIRLQFDDHDPIQQIYVELICARNQQLKLNVSVNARDAYESVAGLSKSSPNRSKQLHDFVNRHMPVAVFVPPFYGTVKDEEFRSRAMVDRLLGSGDQSHVIRNMILRLSSVQLQQLNSFLRDTVGATLKVETSIQSFEDVTHLAVHFQDTNGPLELSSAGAGLINLLALYTSLARWQSESVERRIIYLLDEPEAHLHPRLQADSAERISRLVAEEFSAQLVMATHSVDILNRMSERGALLLRCNRASAPSIISFEHSGKLFADLSEWVDLTPYTAINALASRRILFCEGDDELDVLPRLAELRLRNSPKRLANFREWAIVKLNGSDDDAPRMLSKLIANNAVKLREPATFEVIVALDRDYVRTPGFNSAVEEKGVRSQQLVWSCHSLESLLLEPRILSIWIRAFLGANTPDNLEQFVVDAIKAADSDQSLNLRAGQHLVAHSFSVAKPTDPTSIMRLQDDAMKRVAAQPAVWQRGKDRSRLVLQHVRKHLGRVANQLPAGVVQLVLRADIHRVADPSEALPVEIAALIDAMAADRVGDVS